MNVISLRPKYEMATKYGAYWTEKLYNKKAEKEDFTVTDLFKGDCVRKDLDEAEGKLISGVAHGNSNRIVGQNSAKLLEKDQWTKEECEDAFVWMCSCLSGKSLLPWLADNTAISTMGYKKKFVFYASRFPDGYAEPFFQSHFAGPRALLEGETAEKAYEEMVDTFTDYMKSNEVPEKIKPYLKHDRDCSDYWGDKDAEIRPSPPPEKPTAEVTLTLEKKEQPPEEGKIIAQVNEEQSGDPLPDASVKTEGPTPGEKRSDSNGMAVFDPVEVGPYTITAEKEGYKSDQVSITGDDFDGNGGEIPDPLPIIDVDLPGDWNWTEEPEEFQNEDMRGAKRRAVDARANMTVCAEIWRTEQLAEDRFKKRKETGMPPGFDKEKTGFIGDESIMWTHRNTKTGTILMRWGRYVIPNIPFQVNHETVEKAGEMAEEYAGKMLDNMKDQKRGIKWSSQKRSWQ